MFFVMSATSLLFCDTSDRSLSLQPSLVFCRRTSCPTVCPCTSGLAWPASLVPSGLARPASLVPSGLARPASLVPSGLTRPASLCALVLNLDAYRECPHVFSRAVCVKRLTGFVATEGEVHEPNLRCDDDEDDDDAWPMIVRLVSDWLTVLS